ncbi:MAG: cysteine desulfurase family protein, partial [Actinomycetota bacterium]
MPYLDYAATTPVLPEVADAMAETLRTEFGNPSSVHAYGRRARALVEDARERVAAAVGASPAEIVFTGGGTEADNLALKGAASKLRGNGDHIVISAIEHHAVLESVEWLQHRGFQATTVGVDAGGVADSEAVADEVRPSTVLVSVMSVNNEIGTIQPIAEIGSAVKARNPNAIVHTDAVQALGNVPVDVGAWGADLAAFSAHKLGGPKGVGALYVKAHVPVEPVLHGGGHERGLRSGTLNVAGIVGFGIAAEVAASEVDGKTDRLAGLRARLWDGLEAAIPDISLNGAIHHRIANNINVSVPGADGETLLLLLDENEIACSAGSACQSGAVDPSHVLLAIGTPKELAGRSLR